MKMSSADSLCNAKRTASRDGLLDMLEACDSGDIQSIRDLLDDGASIDLKGGNDYPWYGGTPLHIACRRGFIEIVKELLNRGADVEVFDEYGATPLGNACSYGCPTEILNELLDQGADINARDRDGRTPLMDAASITMTDINRNWNGRTNQSCEIINFLIARGASVNSADIVGGTALHSCYDPDAINALLDAGADIDSRNIRGETCLTIACRRLKVSAVNLLLSRGASLSDFECLIDMVSSKEESRDRQEILKLLKDHETSYVMK